MADLLEDLESLLPALPQAVERRKLGDRLNKAVDALRTAPQQIARLEALFALADEIEFARQPQNAETLNDAKFDAAALGNDLSTFQDAEKLRSAISHYDDSFVKNTLPALDRAIRSHWRTIVADRFKSLAGVGDLLAKIEGTATLGKRMIDCSLRAQRSADGGTAPDLLNQVRQLLLELENLRAEQASALTEGAIGTFLQAAAEQRATLLLVTPEVRTWLEENNALEKFRVLP
jgi:hypothetical protein